MYEVPCVAGNKCDAASAIKSLSNIMGQIQSANQHQLRKEKEERLKRKNKDLIHANGITANGNVRSSVRHSHHIHNHDLLNKKLTTFRHAERDYLEHEDIEKRLMSKSKHEEQNRSIKRSSTCDCKPNEEDRVLPNAPQIIQYRVKSHMMKFLRRTKSHTPATLAERGQIDPDKLRKKPANVTPIINTENNQNKKDPRRNSQDQQNEVVLRKSQQNGHAQQAADKPKKVMVTMVDGLPVVVSSSKGEKKSRAKVGEL